MICPNCGKENPKGVRFCGYCGREISEEGGGGAVPPSPSEEGGGGRIVKLLSLLILMLLVFFSVFFFLSTRPENRSRRYLRLGQHEFEKGDYENAVLHLKKAAELAPKNAAAWIRLARACRELARESPEKEQRKLYREMLSAGRKASELKDLSEAKELVKEAEELLTEEKKDKDGGSGGTEKLLLRPSLLTGIGEKKEEEESVQPAVPEILPASDFSNVESFSPNFFGEREKELLRKNHFVVEGDRGEDEFFVLYEENRYNYIPSFVTVDSMLHSYHLYFQHLLKNTEKQYLAPLLKELSLRMEKKSAENYRALIGTDWEDAALRNVYLFEMGAELLGESPGGDLSGEAEKALKAERARIEAGDASSEASYLTGQLEDYGQYKVRGYYEGDPELSRYFRAMMWYGRMNFSQHEEELDRAALLLTLSLEGEEKEDWEKIYRVTAFFAGESDDNGYYEYRPLLEEAYGGVPELSSLIEDKKAWERFHSLTGELGAPKIQFFSEGSDASSEGDVSFRFMGQRFSIDSAVFQDLIYDSVLENSKGEKRFLPSGLDIPSAFGSDSALKILEDSGQSDFSGYSENMEGIRSKLSELPKEFWERSLYNRWLYSIRPLTEERGKGYPLFMQSSEWDKKKLQSFLGSYAELKHDTILYSKQAIAEMGGDDPMPLDDRGYVEPEPELWSRLYRLAESSGEGLSALSLLSEEDRKNLELLKGLIGQLRDISVKELKNQALSEEDYKLIRGYGGNIEHFWQEVNRGAAGGESLLAREFPAAVIADIASSPDGSCLEAGTGRCAEIYVLVPLDGKLRITRGSVYSYYEFPSEERLTDSRWREMLGIQTQGLGESEAADLKQPDWTYSFTERAKEDEEKDHPGSVG